MSRLRTLRIIFSNLTYSMLAVSVTFSVFSLAVWVPNTRLIVSIVFSGSVPFSEKIGLLWSLYGSIVTNFTVLSASYTVVIAVLFGVNIAVMVYYIKKMRKISSGVRVGGVAGLGGVIAGSLGIGCASCGTFILTSLLGVFGAAGALTFLPLGGAEFGLIGVVLLAYGIYNLLKKLEGPNVCV